MIYKYKYKIGDYAVVNLGDGLSFGKILDNYLAPNPIYRVDLTQDERYKQEFDLNERRIMLTIVPLLK